MISVITPVYNGEKFIGSCIQNVIDQKCSEVEHIIVDGGSKDRTVDIIQRYTAQYPHIRWISEQDQGQADAMNKGVQMARGNIIGVLNVDDYYEPDALNYVVLAFESLPEPSLLVGNCYVWKDQGNCVWLSKPKRLSLTNILIGRTHLVNPSAYFYHTSLHEKIGYYRVDEHYALDVDFAIRAVRSAFLKYVDVNLGNYRMYAETKTVIDTQNGLSTQRKNYYLDLYIKQLPLLHQWMVRSLRALFNLYVRVKSAW